MDDRDKIIKKKWTDSPVYVAFDVAQYIRAFLSPAHLLIAFERVVTNRGWGVAGFRIWRNISMMI